ncbi:thiosulfate sulfurtransferase GlpE [Vibrio sp. JC009]|uniref:thiosulfate sulfurtransferase GlpE n=1 Tax=Vibrio sp. JC009 TaxID=2912314 RepID=UPI0023B1A740|nr:thiosulfate sulfurtransferase GlpE [Vibrio sp. JC009]WED21747.1 thiosulfate sulfurtransferase GlpE [Vibrio sp. JC009]
MTDFKRIDVNSAYALMTQEKAVLVDIRDPGSYFISHPEGASHLGNSNIASFIDEVEPEQAVLVICYHGVSSLGAAQYLVNQGLEDVYSVDGGFEAWKQADLPTEMGE